MFVVVGCMSAAVGILIWGITRDVGLRDAINLAGATGRLQAVDTRFDLSETYTLWSGLIGGLFLSLSYFGCDQSQVQRYLTAKSIDEARHSLLMSAFVKIPLQLLILSTGVLVFLFYLFQTPPMLFNRAYDAQVAGRSVRGGVFRLCSSSSTRRSPPGEKPAWHATRERVSRRRRRVEGDARAGGGHRQEDDRRRGVHRRQLRLSDLHHDADADGAGRPDDRGDFCRGHVGERPVS